MSSKITIPEFANKQDKFNWLVKNERLLIAQKKSAIKKADGFKYNAVLLVEDFKENNVVKAENNTQQVEQQTGGNLKIKVIINSTNFLDSHEDVHIPKLWNKSLKENLVNYLVKEHDFCFDGVITDEVKAYTQTYTWKELGYSYDGSTECLIFEFIIKPDDITDMYRWYKANKVREHSVGMIYVKLYLCINSDDPSHAQYKDNYDKYISYIANAADFEVIDCFWAVTEAKLREGSPVLLGSNSATPTQSVEFTADEEIKNLTPNNDNNTPQVPLPNTQKEPLKKLDLSTELKKVKIKFNNN